MLDDDDDDSFAKPRGAWPDSISNLDPSKELTRSVLMGYMKCCVSRQRVCSFRICMCECDVSNTAGNVVTWLMKEQTSTA